MQFSTSTLAYTDSRASGNAVGTGISAYFTAAAQFYHADVVFQLTGLWQNTGGSTFLETTPPTVTDVLGIQTGATPVSDLANEMIFTHKLVDLFPQRHVFLSGHTLFILPHVVTADPAGDEWARFQSVLADMGKGLVTRHNSTYGVNSRITGDLNGRLRSHYRFN